MVLTLSHGVSESHAFTGQEDPSASTDISNASETAPGVKVLLFPGAHIMVQVNASAYHLTGAEPANTTAADRIEQAQEARKKLISRLPITLNSKGQCRLMTQISPPIEAKTNYAHVSSIPIEGIWTLKCASPQKLKHVDIGLFAMFPALESVSVMVFSEKAIATGLKPIHLKRRQTRVTF